MADIMPDHTILVIEDDESIRETLKIALEFWGYEVITASNGQIAINILSTSPSPCLILTDLMMPVKDGWGVIAFLKADSKLSQIPLILITAYSERAESVKVAAIIKKPINLDLLQKEINKYCPVNK